MDLLWKGAYQELHALCRCYRRRQGVGNMFLRLLNEELQLEWLHNQKRVADEKGNGGDYHLTIQEIPQFRTTNEV